jgi:hypothetical protein
MWQHSWHGGNGTVDKKPISTAGARIVASLATVLPPPAIRGVEKLLVSSTVGGLEGGAVASARFC